MHLPMLESAKGGVIGLWGRALARGVEACTGVEADMGSGPLWTGGEGRVWGHHHTEAVASRRRAEAKVAEDGVGEGHRVRARSKSPLQRLLWLWFMRAVGAA